VYHTYFKTNLKLVADYPALLAFVRACYALPAVKQCTNIQHIKMHYFTSHTNLNTNGIIPGSNGPSLE
jgi:putative glutathione S-transferase